MAASHETGVMVGIIVGVVPIVASIWLYRRGLKVYGVIAPALGIPSLMLGYWSEQTINTEGGSSMPAGTVEGARMTRAVSDTVALRQAPYTNAMRLSL